MRAAQREERLQRAGRGTGDLAAADQPRTVPGAAAHHRAEEHVPPGLLRVSVGCEHVEDLWADLAAALDAAPGAGRP